MDMYLYFLCMWLAPISLTVQGAFVCDLAVQSFYCNLHTAIYALYNS